MRNDNLHLKFNAKKYDVLYPVNVTVENDCVQTLNHETEHSTQKLNMRSKL